MEERLRLRFSEAELAVLDMTGQGNHFEIRVACCEELQSLPRIKGHQEVMSLFDKELKSGEIHALSIKIL